MLLCTQMINGFNTDVPHEGRVYHVQTEDRGGNTLALESLVYIGGTIIAKKSTPYADQLSKGATEEMIASLLKRQHQVIIAAIKAGRIEDLVRHSAKESAKEQEASAAKKMLGQPAPSSDTLAKPMPLPPVVPAPMPPVAAPVLSIPAPPAASPAMPSAAPPVAMPTSAPLAASPVAPPAMPGARPIQRKQTSMLGSPFIKPNPLPPAAPARPEAQTPADTNRKIGTGSLDLDKVISDYLKRSAEQETLDLEVLTPSMFVAGKSVNLRVQVARGADLEPDAVVTVKIIGTAFKPQVFIGRAGHNGVANFSLALPAFTAGTAAIVIEAQSSRGRGELKHLIRRA
jgi:hypothetical protein